MWLKEPPSFTLEVDQSELFTASEEAVNRGKLVIGAGGWRFCATLPPGEQWCAAVFS